MDAPDASDPVLSLVVARAKNGVIGRDGDLPWRIPSDLKRFRQITRGKPVVMGRRTWESLPRKPLPDRPNLVVSTTLAPEDAPGAEVFGDVWHALEAARTAAAIAGVNEICVIGGATLYGLLAERAYRIYVSEVDLEPEGDAVFPELDESDWREVSADRIEPGEGDDAGLTLRVLERRKPGSS